jgi:hypothetical protein
MYGAVGMLAVESVLLLPVARAAWRSRANGQVEGMDICRAAASAVLLSTLDSFLNGSLILPILILIGGLVGSEHLGVQSDREPVAIQEETKAGL